MNKIDRRTISLPAEQGEYIDQLVASGEYGSASEVVRAGIRALQQHDRAIEHWLRTEVAETYDRMQADPGARHSYRNGTSEVPGKGQEKA